MSKTLTDLEKDKFTTTIEDDTAVRVVVYNSSKVVIDNSTMAPLNANAIFNGTSFNTLDYSMLFVTVYSDVGSAIDGLCVETSSDNIVWRDGDCFTILGGFEKTFSFQPNKQYMRVKYTNGGIAQSAFDLHTIAKKTNSKPSNHRIQDSIVTEDDAELVKAVLTGENTNFPGQFLNIKTTAGGNLRVTVDQVDTTTNSLKVINYSHAELHGGDHFAVKKTEALARNTRKDILIVTPNTTRWAHMIKGIESTESLITVSFYENTVTSADGTLDGGYNRNRNSATAHTTVVYEGPTVTSVGTLLYSMAVGVGRGVGGSTRDDEEILLKQNTKYLLRITEANIANTIINWSLDWYEHVSL
jgi:ribosomal protein L35